MSNHLRNNSISKSILLKPLALSIHFALCTGAMLYSSQALASGQEAQHYQIQPMTLRQALNAFALQSDVTISINSDQLNDLTSQGLSGQYTVDQGFAELLKNTDFQVQKSGNGYVLIKKPKIQQPQVRDMGRLKDIDVNATKNRTIASNPNAVQLPVINVIAQDENSYTVNKVQAGSKIEQDLKDVPRSISVISRQQMDDQGITDLHSALEQLGVIFNPTQYLGNDSYSTRGFSLSSFNIDGFANKSYAFSDSPNTGVSKYENVQLLRGPDGLFSGNGQPSGSINLVRKRPTQDFQLKTKLSAGSWNNYLGEIDISSPLTTDGSIRGRAVASYNDTEKFYENAHRKYTTLYGIVEADILNNTTLHVGISYDKADGTGRDSAQQYPRYTNGEMLAVPLKMGYADGVIQHSDSTNIFAGLDHKFNQNWRAKLNISLTKSNYKGITGYYTGAVDPLTGQGTRFGITDLGNIDSDAIASDFNIQGNLDLWGHANKLVFGADYVKTKTGSAGGPVSVTYAGEPFSSLSEINWNTFNPALINIDHNVSTIASQTQYKNIQYGAYFYNSFAITEPLKLILGGRLATYEYLNDFKNSSGIKIPTAKKNKSIFTPYYALQYDFLPDWTAYFTMTEGYEDQSNYYSEDKKPLDPTTSTSYELGIKGQHFDGKLNSSISVYQTKRKNLGVRTHTDQAFGNSNPGKNCCYVGDGEFKGKGIELDLSGEILPNLSVNIGYTYDDSVTDYGANKGKRLRSQSPEHIFRAWGRYQFTGTLEKLAVGGGVRAYSDYFASGTVKAWNPTGGKDGNGAFDGADIAYEFTQDGYFVWDTFANYQINPNWSASLNFNNILNKKYLQNVGTTAIGNMYGEPRNVLFSLKGNF